MKKDYYYILGIDKNAQQADIKKAYKKLAMQWHPDRHQGDKKAEEKFKEINEAYQVLGESEKRKKYDTFGTADFENMGGGSTAGFGGYDFGDLGDIFGNMRGNNNYSQGFEFDLGDLFGGFAQDKKKSRSQKSTYNHTDTSESLDMEQTVELSIWDLLLGTKISIDSPYSGRFKVTVPECTKPGTRLKVSNKGKTIGKHTGHLYLRLEARMPNKLSSAQRHAIENINTAS